MHSETGWGRQRGEETERGRQKGGKTERCENIAEKTEGRGRWGFWEVEVKGEGIESGRQRGGNRVKETGKVKIEGEVKREQAKVWRPQSCGDRETRDRKRRRHKRGIWRDDVRGRE
jgi:hypothetical protein